MGEKKRKQQFNLVFSGEEKEKFAAEVERIFSRLKNKKPFSLGLTDVYWTLEVDVEWIVFDREDRKLTPSEVEFMLGVLASHQTPNVKETNISLYNNEFEDESAEVWKWLPKLNNLTYLNFGRNDLSVISPLVCDLIHLQHLHLNENNVSAQGVVIVCELLKVCCSIVP